MSLTPPWPLASHSCPGTCPQFTSKYSTASYTTARAPTGVAAAGHTSLSPAISTTLTGDNIISIAIESSVGLIARRNQGYLVIIAAGRHDDMSQ